MFFSWGLVYGVDVLICDLLLWNSSSGDVLTQPMSYVCFFLGLTLNHLLSCFNRLHYPKQGKTATLTTHRVKDLSNEEWEKETPPLVNRQFLTRDVARFGTGTGISAFVLFGAFKVFRNLAPYHISHLTSQDYNSDQSPTCPATTPCLVPVALLVSIVKSSPSLWAPFSVCCPLCV